MLPGPGLVHLVGAERFEGRRDRPLPPRRAQPHVHLVKPACRGRRGDGGQKGLRQARIIGARRQGPWPRGPLGLGRVVDHDQVQVRVGVQLPRAQRAHAQHRCPVPGRRTVAARELGRDHGRQRRQRRVRDVGVLLARFLGLDQPAQVVDAHAELPFVRPAPGGVERPFIPAIGGGHRAVERGRQFGTHRLESRPRREEAARQHRVQHLGVARQISGQARRGRADVAQKVDQRGVRFEHREELHPRRQPAQEAVEAAQRLAGAAGAEQAGQDTRLDPGKDLLGADRPERGVALPALDQRRLLGAEPGAIA